jgi:Sec-independent protein translocase protein TatA
MLLFINNVNPTELLLIAVVAVLVFGRKLPEVASQAAGHLAKAKRAISDLRRDSGLDEELRRARSAAQELDPRRVLEPPRPTRASDGVARGKAPSNTVDSALPTGTTGGLAPTPSAALADRASQESAPAAFSPGSDGSGISPEAGSTETESSPVNP